MGIKLKMCIYCSSVIAHNGWEEEEGKGSGWLRIFGNRGGS